MIAARPGLAFTPHRPHTGRVGAIARVRLALVHLTVLALAALPLMGSAGCDRENGEIELNWSIVDRAGNQLAPFGALGDTCNFTGILAADAEPSTYDLQLRLRLCESDCAGGCDDPECLIRDLRYDCSAARGFSVVPARTDSPYELVVDLVANPRSDACTCALTPPCALAPGPRRRTVEAGLVTDLQVYLLVLGLDNINASLEGGRPRLDLDACCTPDPTCSVP